MWCTKPLDCKWKRNHFEYVQFENLSHLWYSSCLVMAFSYLLHICTPRCQQQGWKGFRSHFIMHTRICTFLFHIVFWTVSRPDSSPLTGFFGFSFSSGILRDQKHRGSREHKSHMYKNAFKNIVVSYYFINSPTTHPLTVCKIWFQTQISILYVGFDQNHSSRLSVREPEPDSNQCTRTCMYCTYRKQRIWTSLHQNW